MFGRKKKESAPAIQKSPRKPFVKAVAATILAGFCVLSSCSKTQISTKTPDKIEKTEKEKKKSPKKKAVKKYPEWERFAKKYGLSAEDSKDFFKHYKLIGKGRQQYLDVLTAFFENKNLQRRNSYILSRVLEKLFERTHKKKGYSQNSRVEYKKAQSELGKNIRSLSSILGSPNIGKKELRIILKLFECPWDTFRMNIPTHDISTAKEIFCHKNYSPEVAKLFYSSFILMKHFPPKVVLREFKVFLNNSNNTQEMLQKISEIQKYSDAKTSEIFGEFRSKGYGQGTPEFLANQPQVWGKKDLFRAFVKIISNPQLNEQMLEDLSFEIKTLLEYEHCSKNHLRDLSYIYSSKLFDPNFSAKLRTFFKKKGKSVSIPQFLEGLSDALTAKGAGKKEAQVVIRIIGKFGKRADNPLNALSILLRKKTYSQNALVSFEGHIGELVRAKGDKCSWSALVDLVTNENYSQRTSMLVGLFLRESENDNISSSLNALLAFLQEENYSPDKLALFDEFIGTAIKKSGDKASYVGTQLAELLTNKNYSQRTSRIIRLFLRKSRKNALLNSLDALSALMENEHYDEELLDEFEEIYRKILGRAHTNRAAVFADLRNVLSFSKSDRNILGKISFTIEKKNANLCSSLTLVSILVQETDFFTKGSFDQSYEEARSFAESVGANYKNREVVFNFAYALEKIGKSKTRKLFEANGIEYFARYSTEFLEEVYKTSDPGYRKNSLPLLVVFNKNDWNGAFYDGRDKLYSLTEYYAVTLIETDVESLFYEKAREIWFTRSSIPGAKKQIGALILGGHGFVRSITLGSDRKGEKAEITYRDMGEFGNMRKYFVSKPIVLLQSCSTGRNKHSIGARVSRALGAILYAPKKPGSIRSDLDKKGRIVGVIDGGWHNEFHSGEIKQK